MQQETAETLALRALAWLAADPDTLGAFLGQTGVDGADLRQLAGDRAFLAGVLGWLVAEDARVIAFCDAEGLAYTLPLMARDVLAGDAGRHWT